jgi:hypothetical protein
VVKRSQGAASPARSLSFSCTSSAAAPSPNWGPAAKIRVADDICGSTQRYSAILIGALVVRTEQMIPIFSFSSAQGRPPWVPDFTGMTEKEWVPNVKIIPLKMIGRAPWALASQFDECPLSWEQSCLDRIGKLCDLALQQGTTR